MSRQTTLNGVCSYSYTQCHGISTELESSLKSALDKIHSLGKKFPSNTLTSFPTVRIEAFEPIKIEASLRPLLTLTFYEFMDSSYNQK